jgi:hypothetical protein
MDFLLSRATFGISHALLSLVYAHNSTVRCYCGKCIVKEGRWQKKIILLVEFGALAYGKLEGG